MGEKEKEREREEPETEEMPLFLFSTALLFSSREDNYIWKVAAEMAGGWGRKLWGLELKRKKREKGSLVLF